MKKKTILILSLALLITIAAVGATFAFLSAQTDPVTNTFTVGNNIKITLDEPSWNPDNAKNFVPGRVIPKDPFVTNNTGSNTAWIAIKLDYVDGTTAAALTYADVAAMANIDLDTAATGAWVANSDNTVFYFKTTVAAGAATSKLFQNVTIKNIDYSLLKSFKINVTGYAIQAEGFTLDTAKTQFNTSFGLKL